MYTGRIAHPPLDTTEVAGRPYDSTGIVRRRDERLSDYVYDAFLAGWVRCPARCDTMRAPWWGVLTKRAPWWGVLTKRAPWWGVLSHFRRASR